MKRQESEIPLAATLYSPVSRPASPSTAALFAVVFLLGACKDELTRNPNLVDETVLAQDLVQDRQAVDEYLMDFPRESYEIVEVPELGRFYIDGNPALVKKTLRSGQRWEPEIQEVMSRHARSGSTVLDVGAHIGSHTLWLSRLVGPEGVVYAFEPQKKIYRELVMNLELNAVANVIPLRFAVGSHHDVIEMISVHDAEGRVRRDGAVRVGKGGDDVELRTIDSFGFSNVSLVKIDVETYEAPVLMGAEQTLRAWHPAVIVEILHAESYADMPPSVKKRIDSVREILERLGYELTLISCGGGCDYLALYTGPNPLE